MTREELKAAFAEAKENKGGRGVELQVAGQKTNEVVMEDWRALDVKLED